MKRSMIILLIVLSSIIFANEDINVTFINPGYSTVDNPTGGFWINVSHFMEAAARDLNMNLEILYSNRNHFKMKSLGIEVANRRNPPDYLIIVNEKLFAEPILEEADKNNVKTFVMLNTFKGEQKKRMGEPRKKYKYWIGSLIPDNIFAGYKITEKLVEKAREKSLFSENGKIEIVGFSGDFVTQASVERNQGLKQFVNENSDTHLNQIINCEWSKDIAKFKGKYILKRYPTTNILWAANDPIALGAMEAATNSSRNPGKDILIGGLNWDIPALKKIQSEEIVTSIGGHFMTGGWTLIMLYDYHNGIDFANRGLEQKRKIFSAIDSNNVDSYINLFGDENWDKIDFKKISKHRNSDIDEYKFNLDSILKQFN